MKPGLRERLLTGLLNTVASAAGRRTSEWVRAAMAELSAEPDPRARRAWLGGTLGMALGDLAGRTLLPWRDAGGEPPPAGFAAVAGGYLLVLPTYFINALLFSLNGAPQLYAPIALLTGDPARAQVFRVVAPALIFGSIALAGWINLGMVLRGRRVGGLNIELRVALRLLNLCILGFAVCLTMLLLNHLGDAFAPPLR